MALAIGILFGLPFRLIGTFATGHAKWLAVPANGFWLAVPANGSAVLANLPHGKAPGKVFRLVGIFATRSAQGVSRGCSG